MKAEKYIDDTGFEGYKVLKSLSLNYLDLVGNSNKFYTIELHEHEGKYRVFTHYGRLGAKGTKQVRYPDTFQKAEREFNHLVGEKEAKGYVIIELAQSATGSEKATQLVNKSNVIATNLGKKASNLEPEIERFVRQIFEEAGMKLSQLVEGNFESSGASPLGKLSIRQIEKGKQILQEISRLMHSKKQLDMQDVYLLCREYYTYIPKVFGHKIKVEDSLITNPTRLREEMDTLSFYEDVIRMGSVIYDNENLDAQYDSLSTTIEVLDKQDPKFEEIVAYVNGSESNYHSVSLKVEQIYKVKQKNAPILDTSYGNIQSLFHGSRTANLPGILSSHLKLPMKLEGVHITGAMFGPGLYFADQSTKSSQYACAKFGGTSNKQSTAFLFLCDVSLGKIHKVTNSHYFMDAPKGYDSVMGVKGPNLLHNEFIVYRENQQQIRYIIEFTPVTKRRG